MRMERNDNGRERKEARGIGRKKKLKKKKVRNKGKERNIEKCYIKENQREGDLNCWSDTQLRKENRQLAADLIRPEPSDHPWSKAIRQALICPIHRDTAV
jgi:hypothetical protein